MTRGVCVVCGGALPARLRHPHQITCGPRCRDERKRRRAAEAQARRRKRQAVRPAGASAGAVRPATPAPTDLTETDLHSAGLAAINDLPPAAAVAVTVTVRRQDGSTVTGTVTRRAAHGLLADDAAADGEDARLAALAGGTPVG